MDLLGARIRALRKEQGLSLEELARRSGVAVGSLSKIENGKGGGTVKTTRRLAEGLGITLAELYRGLEEPQGEAVVVESEPKGAETFNYDEKASAVLLTTQLSGKNMLPQLIVLQPEGKTTVEEYRRGTQRWLFALEGAVEIKLGEKSYRVAKGGSLYLDASIPHQILNANRSAARLISVISPVAL